MTVNKKILAAIIALIITGVIFLAFNLRRPARTCNAKAKGVSASAILAQAKGQEIKNNLLEAKLLYQKLVDDFPGASEVVNWQKKSEEMNIKLLFSPTITPGSLVYEIKPGDTLDKIARAFRTTTELIMKSNMINDSRIIPGRKIKVWNAPFSIFVDKSQNILLLKSNEEVIKSYIVSTGKNNSTPVGTFKIVNKLPNPTWFKTGTAVAPGSPDNVLGTRWMGFDIAGYGIHGTTEPKELGRQVTQGCVRLSNSDAEELYSIVPVGTEVTVVD